VLAHKLQADGIVSGWVKFAVTRMAKNPTPEEVQACDACDGRSTSEEESSAWLTALWVGSGFAHRILSVEKSSWLYP
jgi:hypothetical protein